MSVAYIKNNYGVAYELPIRTGQDVVDEIAYCEYILNGCKTASSLRGYLKGQERLKRMDRWWIK